MLITKCQILINYNSPIKINQSIQKGNAMILEEKLSAILITQGLHKFYSLTMPIELIADSCSPNPRASDPIAGFQRNLDEKRADSIADYIRTGGTIPSSIILSAQSDSNFIYDRKTKLLNLTSRLNLF